MFKVTPIISLCLSVSALQMAMDPNTCIPDNFCSIKNDWSKCCSNQVYDTSMSAVKCTVKGSTCGICKQAITTMANKVIGGAGCVELAVESAVVCNAIGLGPEDPATWVCMMIVDGSCASLVG